MFRFVPLFIAVIAVMAWLLAPIAAQAWQYDSNTNTTTTTSYTPEKPSDILIGRVLGQWTAWISLGQTTNDWDEITLTAAQLAALTSATSAVQATDATYTSTVAKAASALQPSSVNYTGTIITAGATNIFTVLGGKITAWTVDD